MSDSASVTLPEVTVTPTPAQPSAKSTEPYAVRKLNFTFQMSAGSTFSGTGSSSLTLTGLAATAHVEFANTPNQGAGQFRIWGMTLDDMNALSRAGLVYKVKADKPDSIMVEAGDDISGMTTVFSGIIFESYPDMRAAPNTSFFVSANPAQLIQLKPVPPSTFTGATTVATALEAIIKPAGLTLENNGVNTVLASPYFPGTVWDQINAAVRAADCFAFLDKINNKLAIWPKTGSRSGGTTVVIAAKPGGMIGYPEFQAVNVKVRTLFNTNVTPGGKVEIQSQLTAANGSFVVVNVVHDLASQLVDGPWETLVLCTPGK